MEMDAGVALTATATGTGGWGAGGLGARCLVDLVGAGGWGSTTSGSLEATGVSCRKMKQYLPLAFLVSLTQLILFRILYIIQV